MKKQQYTAEHEDSGQSRTAGAPDRRALVIPNEIFFEQVAETLSGGSPVTFTVKGYSMYPFMRSDKDAVCLKRYDGGVLLRGDVVLFRYRGRYILHRIVKVTDGISYELQGDGNLSGMEKAVPDTVCGVMTGRISPSGKEWKCSSLSWKTCSALWMFLRPFRRIMLAVLRRIYR